LITFLIIAFSFTSVFSAGFKNYINVETIDLIEKEKISNINQLFYPKYCIIKKNAEEDYSQEYSEHKKRKLIKARRSSHYNNFINEVLLLFIIRWI